MIDLQEIELWARSDGVQQPMLLTGVMSDAILREFVGMLPTDTFEIIVCDPETESITLKNIEDLLSQLLTTAIRERRVIGIPAAHRLLPEASNALLKSLEEAANRNRFLLSSSFPGRLLPTIRSRCHVITISDERPQETALEPVPIFDPKRKQPLTTVELHAISSHIQSQVTGRSISPELMRSLMRLKDVYKVQAAGGNTRMASDALLASLTQLDDNRSDAD